MAMTDAQAKLLLGHEFGIATYTPPDNMWLGLSSTPINNDGTGETEPPSSCGYGRVQMPMNGETWRHPIGDNKRYILNRNEITFNLLTSATGNVEYWFLSTAATGGEIKYFGQLDSTKLMDAYSRIVIDPAQIRIFRLNSELDSVEA